MRSSLVPFRPHGELRPVFFVHEASGHVDYARELARRFDPNIPVYGLEADGFFSGELPLRSIPDMIARYVEAIRSVQVTGPYRLMGWSAGGIIAYAIAEQLLKDGDKVAFVGLVDAHLGGGLGGVIERVLSQRNVGRDGAAYFLQAITEDYLPSDAREAFRAIAEVGAVAPVAEFLKAHGVLPRDLEGPMLDRALGVRMGIAEALYRYRPAPIPVTATLFRAALVPASTLADPTAGWGALLGECLVTVPIQGNHYTMMAEPHIAQLSQAMVAALRESNEPRARR
jgi:thioesterase domain-containing protein